MKTIILIYTIIMALGLNSVASTQTAKEPEQPPPKIIGSRISLNVDFDIIRQRLRRGTKQKPHIYFINPAPNKAINDPYLTYLGRMPRGTILEIVDVEKEDMRIKKTYWVKPLSPINEIIKDSPYREAYPSFRNLENQVFEISRNWRDSGLFGDSDEVPTLDKKWFTIIDTND